MKKLFSILWLLAPSELDKLMDAAAYKAMIGE